jgi:hypothetical protein
VKKLVVVIYDVGMVVVFVVSLSVVWWRGKDNIKGIVWHGVHYFKATSIYQFIYRFGFCF